MSNEQKNKIDKMSTYISEDINEKIDTKIYNTKINN